MARRFQAQEQTIYRDLTSTMRALAASDLRVRGRNLVDPKDNEAEVTFIRKGVRYVVRCKKWVDPLDNLRAVERTIFALYRAAEDYGVSTGKLDAISSVFDAFQALPGDQILALGAGSWWQVLGLEQKPTNRAALDSAYRAMARVHHPDTGGDPAQFKALRAAYEQGQKEVV